MRRQEIESIFKKVKDGSLDVPEAMKKFRHAYFEDLRFAKVDTHRDIRRGFPEVIFCQNKTLSQIRKIAERMFAGSKFVMATKAGKEVYEVLKSLSPSAEYFESARIVIIGKNKKKASGKPVLVISAGTSDIPVAEEAAITAEILGARVDRLFDVGVAGLHRLLNHKEKILNAGIIIVVAGMDGVLPSLVGSLVDVPLIAVPTSVGYGSSFKGLSALLTMLNSCVPGIAVVNIDNGFGAGYFAGIMLKNKR
ncbi:MAG: nickel pincer cofactor biosynthesis protein LarB [Candidatus Omnitrophica bacterium]|nr:nickel pincer cofactor biosynthesis protein LarB [Candidatus Omnitrophota bacterium]